MSSFAECWARHKHVRRYRSQVITIDHINRIKYIECFQKIKLMDCPYGPNCPMFYQGDLFHFWPPPYSPHPLTMSGVYPPVPQGPVSQAQYMNLPPVQAIDAPGPSPNDIIEFDTSVQTSAAFVDRLRAEILRCPPSNLRVWEHVSTQTKLDSVKTMQIKVMSYNVLSQMLLESHSYIYNSCKKENLIWEGRWERIFNEVLIVDPDIFCLQEVHHTHLPFYKRFQKIGYRGFFKKKTSSKMDGCAVFFKDSKFEIIEVNGVHFHKKDLPFLSADNIGIMLKLALRFSPYTQLVVATTHLLYTPVVPSTRLGQMRILMHEIEKFSFHTVTGEHLPVILTGDFNSDPNSTVIKFLCEGRVCIPIKESLEHYGVTETSLGTTGPHHQTKSEVNEATKSNDATPGTLAQIDTNAHIQNYRLAIHPFKLSSVYKVENMKNNINGRRWLTVDHIYYTNNNLRLLKRLGPPNNTNRRKIPNEVFGSDHISIAALFEMEVKSPE